MIRRSGAALAVALVASLLPSLSTLAGWAGSPAAAAAAAVAAATPVPGTITTVAGGPAEGPGLEIDHEPVALATSGNVLYVADVDQIHALDLTTGLERVVLGPVAADLVGEGVPARSTGAGQVGGLAVDGAGNLHFSQSSPNAVRRIDARTGLVTTVAGGDSNPEAVGDGGPATQASLVDPGAIAFDGAGNLYIADNRHRRVRRVDTAGIITTVVGGVAHWDTTPGVPATNFPFNGGPIAIGPDGLLYFGDSQDPDVYRVEADGTVSEIDYESPQNGGYPTGTVGLAFLTDGTLVISDVNALQVRARTVAGHSVTLAALNRPGAIAVGPQDKVYVAHANGRRVFRIDAGSVLTPVAGTGSIYPNPGDGRMATSVPLREPNGIFVDASGAIYLTEWTTLRVRKITPEGIITTLAGTGREGLSGDGGPGPQATITMPGGITVGPDGSVYFQDLYQIRRIAPSGVITTFAGTGEDRTAGDEGPALLASFGRDPNSSGSLDAMPSLGLAFDATGELFVADSLGLRIRRIDRNGIIHAVAAADGYVTGLAMAPNGAPTWSTVSSIGARVATLDAQGRPRPIAGGPAAICPTSPVPASAVSVPDPRGVAYDPSGNLYVGDAEHDCVLRIDPAGWAVTVAGRDEHNPRFAGDGGPAHAATFAQVRGLTTDRAGNLFVLDGYRIRRIERPGLTANPTSFTAAGWNAVGQLGDGTTTDRIAPTAVNLSTAGGVRSLGSGLLHGLAAMADGTVRTWGWNGYSQLGDGTTNRSQPVTVAGLNGVGLVAAGAYHSLAVKADGTVWAWGWNGLGQLGDGTTTTRATPVRVAGLTRVVAVAAGMYHSLALRDDGTVWAWGWNGFGQLGDGTTVDGWTPVRARGLTGVRSIAAGSYHSLAVDQGTVGWTWGWNALGQLGNRTSGDPTVPARAVVDVTAMAGGLYHTVAVTTGGRVLGWGGNQTGQLGDGTTVNTGFPLYATGVSGVTAVAAGPFSTLVTTDTGAVRGWGWNGVGLLGDGSTTTRLQAVTFGSGTAASPRIFSTNGYTTAVL